MASWGSSTTSKGFNLLPVSSKSCLNITNESQTALRQESGEVIKIK
jgi:hypothetical protein